MPAVVRGGRRQSTNPPAKRGGAPGPKGRGRAPRNAPATPGKMAAIGRLDLSPRAVVLSIAAGVVLLGVVLATGARAEPNLLYSSASQTNLDRNSVDMDRERAAFADNSVKYEATLRFINGNVRTMLDAIKGQ